MTVQRFMSQSYFSPKTDGTITDTRIPVAGVEVPLNQSAYEFAPEPSMLPFTDLPQPEHVPFGAYLRVENGGYVNGLIVRGYAPRDGETYSGAIELIEIHTPDGRKKAAIRSWDANNDTGLPAQNTSWVAEFDDAVVALDFWKQWKNPKFGKGDAEEALAVYQDSFLAGTIDPEGISVYEVGLLRPWFNQTTKDAPLLERFATHGDRVIKVSDRLPVADDFTPGTVYKIARAEGIRRPAKRYRIATCLHAINVKEREWAWTRSATTDFVAIQWNDGTFRTYPRGDRQPPLPTPLTSRELAKPKLPV